eukprot:826468-Rhodomonas_salina.2
MDADLPHRAPSSPEPAWGRSGSSIRQEIGTTSESSANNTLLVQTVRSACVIAFDFAGHSSVRAEAHLPFAREDVVIRLLPLPSPARVINADIFARASLAKLTFTPARVSNADVFAKR